MNEPLVHVLVITCNGREHLRECFDSLLASTYANARLVLIDNGSEDGSGEFVRDAYGHDPRLEIVRCPRDLGWGGGNNVGLQRAQAAGADYAFLLNDDTVTAPDAIERLVETAENQADLGALAPKILLYDHPDLLNSVGMDCSIIGCGWDIGMGRLDGERWNERRPVLGVCGAACFLRLQTLRKTGLFPPEFRIYLDDLDLCMRIWNAGYTISSCPEAVVRHKFSATMGRGERARHKYYLNTRNRMWLVMRNFPWSRLPRVKVALSIGECRAIGRAILDGEFWKVAAHLKAWAAGAAYLGRALAERRRRRGQGTGKCRFWRLIRTDRLFFGGVDLPKDGWYALKEVKDKKVRPMSARARCCVDAGKLRVVHVNCYPHLGATNVQLIANGEVITTLETLDSDETVIDTPCGTLDIVARRIFDGDQTGEPVDLGGWIGVEPA